MPIDARLVRDLEQLAGLRLDAGERELLAGQLARIVAFVDQLSELDTTGIEPCSHAGTDAGPRRLDQPHPSLPPGEVLDQAPATVDDFFIVPPVFGPGEEEQGDV